VTERRTVNDNLRASSTEQPARGSEQATSTLGGCLKLHNSTVTV
jgi:hypothetical protein